MLRVARNTVFAGIEPGPARRQRRHLVAVVAFDGVVLTDFAIPCDVFGLARLADGQPAYDVRVCGVRPTVNSACVSLTSRASLTLLRKADTIVVPGFRDVDVNRRIPD